MMQSLEKQGYRNICYTHLEMKDIFDHSGEPHYWGAEWEKVGVSENIL